MSAHVSNFTPREIVGELDRYIVGQGKAKRAVAIAMRNRWRRQQVPMAGFVLAHLGHVPKIGEAFEAHDARFTAILATARHVKRVGIELLGRPSPNGERARRMDRAHNTKAAK